MSEDIREEAEKLIRERGLTEAARQVRVSKEAAAKRNEAKRAEVYQRTLREISRRQRIEVIGETVGWAGGLSMLCGVGVIGWQCYWWLRTAIWFSMTLQSGFHQIGVYPEEMVEAIVWRGLAKILEWFLVEIPLSGFLLVVGIWIAGFGMYVRGTAERS